MYQSSNLQTCSMQDSKHFCILVFNRNHLLYMVNHVCLSTNSTILKLTSLHATKNVDKAVMTISWGIARRKLKDLFCQCIRYSPFKNKISVLHRGLSG